MTVPQLDNEAIFHAARDIPTVDRRREYVRQACDGDETRIAQVQALLAAAEEPDSLLDCPAGSPRLATIDEPPVERPGTEIGPYKLLQQIGEGGMGVVYMAEQTLPIARRVALKIIKPGMDSRQVIARFEAERQALSLMDHPNIAKVLDAGTTVSGRPFFVMELVKGQPITHYCDEHHLTPRQRLELLLPVCQAIQHAHQKGIIHRDIKPTNILVAEYDQKAVPKVIDFGVAKATSQALTEKTMFTNFGQIVGTLEYMSPEQAKVNQLDIDTRSDIYSLGVLLYELLTGSTPFDKQRLRSAAWDEMLRIIREEEPPKPSTRLSENRSRLADGTSPVQSIGGSGSARQTEPTLASIAAVRSTEPARLSKLIRGELDWIAMKALEKDRHRRYETASALAADLQHYLSDEPVIACPPSAAYRMRKFVRRNKGVLAATSLVLFFLVLLGSGIGWAVRERMAHEAELAQDRAKRDLERDARRAKATGQVESILTEVDRLVEEQKWPEALAAVQRAEAAVISGEVDGATMERVRTLLKDFKFIERLEQIRMIKGTLVAEHFDFVGVHREYAQAFHEYGVDVLELPAETSIDRLKSRPALAIPVAAALDDWVNVPNVLSEMDAAGRMLLMSIARGIDLEPIRDRLRSTWGQPESDVQEKLRQLADSIDIRTQHPATLVSLARTLRRVGQSDSALQLLLKAQYVDPGDFWLNFDLGAVLREHKDYESAIRYGTAAVSIRPNFSAAHYALGLALRNQGKDEEAIAAYRKAIELDPQFYNAYLGLGNALSRQGKLDDAIDCLRKAIDLDPKQSPAHCNLGRDLLKQGKVEEAMACCKTALQLDPNNARAHGVLGNILYEGLRDYENAAASFRKEIELDPTYAPAYCSLGSALYGQNKVDDAITAYLKAIELDPKYTHAGCLSGALWNLCFELANPANQKFRDPKRAVDLGRDAVELDPRSVRAWQYLGWAHYRAGNWSASVEALDKSCELQPGGTGDSFQWIVLALAHARLATQEELPSEERARHQTEARRWYEQAGPIISNRWQIRPDNRFQGAVWDFHVEAKELLAPNDNK